jgi:predicted transcriptional regulator YdeE
LQPRFIEKPAMFLVGFNFFGDPFRFSSDWSEENEIGRLWKRFMAYLTSHPGKIKHVKQDLISYEMHIQHEETPLTGEFEVFAGIEVELLEEIPIEMVVKILPATTYAVFTFKGAEITSDWSKVIYEEGISKSGYQSAYPYNLQAYDERFKGLEHIDESILDVYVPVKKS